ncbi:MAG: alanine racemase [Christensenellales bacterium]|jgi:alanine racemase
MQQMQNIENIVSNSYLLIDQSLLCNNIRCILDEIGDETALIAVLKDNAFGLGLLQVAAVLAQFDEIKTMAVAQIAEGAELRRSGIGREILVMGGCPSFLNRVAIENDLTVAAVRPGLAADLALEASQRGTIAKVEVKIETGLHRVGLRPGEELAGLIQELNENAEHVLVTGAFSHFADISDAERTKEQFEAFMQGVSQLRAAGIALPRLHISGSAASEHFPQYNLDAVRIGRRLYMNHPTNPVGGVAEVASWRGFITHVRTLKAGSRLGYGRGILLEKDSVIAVVGVGYGDGLNQRLAEAGAPVLLGGRRGRLIGCCMDQCFIDVTGIDCRVDDEVTFFGYDGMGNFLSSQEVALLIGDDEGCGLTSALGQRVQRIFH